MLGGISIWQLLIIVVLFLPVILVIFSKKARGNNKFIWLAMTLLLWWIGYFAYYFSVVRKLPKNAS